MRGLGRSLVDLTGRCVVDVAVAVVVDAVAVQLAVRWRHGVGRVVAVWSWSSEKAVVVGVGGDRIDKPCCSRKGLPVRDQRLHEV